MEKDIIEELFGNTITNKEEKEKVASKIASKVRNGDVIGFGSGSTSFLAVQAIANKIKEEKLNVMAIPTSYEITLLCSKLGIPTTNIIDRLPDWCFDGADEVDKNKWLIKGRGGALFREKLNIANSKITYILADKSKFVDNLGEKFDVPVECHPEALNFVKKRLLKLGAREVSLRMAKGKDGPIITENGNIIFDAKFENIYSDLEKDIKSIVGVIESGLFIGYNIEVIN